MMNCRWCPNEFEDSELTVLSITMPNNMGAHLFIHNNLCPSCRERVFKALADTEIAIGQEARNAISSTT